MDQETHYTIAVVGLGKIGLPLAAQFAGRGQRVIGCDINPAVVAAVNAGECPIVEEPGLEERVNATVAAGCLTATTDTAAAVRQSNVVVIIVPLLVDEAHAVDYSAVDAATRAVAQGLQPRTLVLYETTLPVGTTRERLGALLEAGSGLTMGRDFALAFSPERVYSGRIFRDLATYPKVVGGIDPTSTAAAVAFYAAVLDDAPVLAVRDAETAELVKLLETTYRDVNIALASEFARYAAGARPAGGRGHRRRQHPALFAHPPARHRRRRALHPGLPLLPDQRRPGGRPDRAPRRPAGQRRDGAVGAGPAGDGAGRAGRAPRPRPGLQLPGERERDGFLCGQTADPRTTGGRSHGFALRPPLHPRRTGGQRRDPRRTWPPCRRWMGWWCRPTTIISRRWTGRRLAAAGCRVVFDGRNALDAAAQATIRAAGMAYLGIGR